jgi:hypothetical protein
MGFMDKVKAQAEQAVAKAQQGVAQGQTKLDDLQAKRAGDALIAALGTAIVGPVPAPVAPVAPAEPIPPAAPVDPAAPIHPVAEAPAPPAATGGSFSLDDI